MDTLGPDGTVVESDPCERWLARWCPKLDELDRAMLADVDRRLGLGHPPLRVYDCRHAAATTWLAAGVPLREVARRMGHSVDTLVSTYVGALTGDEDLADRRIEALLGGGQAWPR